MKKFKMLFTTILISALILGNVAGSISVKAAFGINFVGVVDDIIGVPGETTHVKLPVRAVGDYIQEPKITVNTDEMPFTVSKITYNDGTSNQQSLGISYITTTYIEFDIKLKETAPIGKYKLDISVEFLASTSNSVEMQTLKLPSLYLINEIEKEPVQFTVDNITMENAIKGNDTELSFIIKNEGEISARTAYFSIEGYEAAGIIPKYSKLTQEVGVDGKLQPGGIHHVKLPVTISTGATPGNKTLTVNFEYKDIDGNPFKHSVKIYVNVEDNELAPKIEVESVKYASELKTGDMFNLVVTLRNAGLTLANDIHIDLEGLGVESFIENYTSETIDGGDLDKGDKLDIKIPLIVSKEASGGLKKLDIKVDYKDEGNVDYKAATTVYLDVVAADGVTAEGKPNIVVGNVAQSPNAPNAGARVDISFDLENKSKIDISEIKLGVTNLTASNFSPVNLEPYQYIEKLEGGKKARITIPLTISNSIPEGMNSLEVSYEYKDANGKEWTDKATLYVLDIMNNANASKPKLMISNFSTDIEELRAGSVFNFNYEIKNTHSNINAKNIKITITQAENIFSVTKGSNTSYVTRIGAGEVVENSIELKVKSDATTKAYPIDITIEYEYDGAEANPTTGEVGETVKETINLQAIENTRPVVDNINLGYGEMPTINQPTPLTFEFYNMGKSPLNNVRVEIEGDFYLSTGSMFFLGNIQSGTPEYAELEVIPTVEGPAKGNILVTFEDSNGDEVNITKEFESTVQGEFIPEPNGGMDPGFEVPVGPTAKAKILDVWAFVLLQIAVVIIMIPVARKVTLVLYRKKLRKQEEMNDK